MLLHGSWIAVRLHGSIEMKRVVLKQWQGCLNFLIANLAKSKGSTLLHSILRDTFFLKYCGKLKQQLSFSGAFPSSLPKSNEGGRRKSKEGVFKSYKTVMIRLKIQDVHGIEKANSKSKVSQENGATG